MTISSYVPGDWTAVVTDGFIALLGPSASPQIAENLWESATSGASFIEGLSTLAAGGFGSLPSFVLAVQGAEKTTHVAVRGEVQVDLTDGTSRMSIDGRGVATWAERSLAHMTSLAVRVPHAGEGPQLPLVAGVVRLGSLRSPRGAMFAEESADAEEAHLSASTSALAEADSPEPALTPTDAATPEYRSELTPLDPNGGLHEPLDTDPFGVVPPAFIAAAPPLTPLSSSDAAPALAPLPARTPRPVPAGKSPKNTLGGTELDQTDLPEADLDPVTMKVFSQAVTEPADASYTILSDALADVREAMPAWTPDGHELSADVPAAVNLVLSTGLVVALDRPVLLGRAPQATRVSSQEMPRLVAVPSPQQDISRTHAEVRLEGEDVLVTDLDSTNGVHVLRPGRGARRLRPSEPRILATDETIDLGDGVTFTVERMR